MNVASRILESKWPGLLVAIIVVDWFGGFDFILSAIARPQRVVAQHAESSCFEKIDGLSASRECSTIYFRKIKDNKIVDVWWCTSNCKAQAPLTVSGDEYLMFHIALPFEKSLVTGIELPP